MQIKKEALEAVDNLIERLANSIESKPILSGDPSETAKNLNIRTKTLTDLLAARAMYENNGSLSGESLEEDYERFKKYMTEFAEKDFFKAAYSDHAGIQMLITPKGRETFRLLIKDLEGADG